MLFHYLTIISMVTAFNIPSLFDLNIDNSQYLDFLEPTTINDDLHDKVSTDYHKRSNNDYLKGLSGIIPGQRIELSLDENDENDKDLELYKNYRRNMMANLCNRRFSIFHSRRYVPKVCDLI